MPLYSYIMARPDAGYLLLHTRAEMHIQSSFDINL